MGGREIANTRRILDKNEKCGALETDGSFESIFSSPKTPENRGGKTLFVRELGSFFFVSSLLKSKRRLCLNSLWMQHLLLSLVYSRSVAASLVIKCGSVTSVATWHLSNAFGTLIWQAGTDAASCIGLAACHLLDLTEFGTCSWQRWASPEAVSS